MVRIFLLTFVIGLTVGAFPAVAEKQYKMSCYEWCARKSNGIQRRHAAMGPYLQRQLRVEVHYHAR